MLKQVLNEQLSNIINYKIDTKVLNELRIRHNKPIVAFMKGQPYYLCEKGLSCNFDQAIYGTKEMIEQIIFRASDFSIYSVNEQIKNGFIVLDNGIRIGLAGSYIKENNSLKTINNWTSVNIRIPHQIKNASLGAFSYIVSEQGIKNSLIISPPGAGKTTFIRDFVFQMSSRNYCSNVTIIDERGEIAGGENCDLNLGNFCDVVSFCNKKEGINQSIRTLSPSLIVTDELEGDMDFEIITSAQNCGVKVMATLHANNIEDLKRKSFFKNMAFNCFDRYVVLSSRNGPGTIEGVFNEKFARICEW